MKALRTQLQLSQKELAALIGVSPSVLCRHEKGLRNLPASASQKLAQLQLTMLQNEKAIAASGTLLLAQEQKLYNKAEKTLNAHARKAAANAVLISYKLSNMQDRYQCLLKKLHLLHTMMQQTERGTRNMSLLQNLEMDTLNAMARCAPARQMLAEYRLQLLKSCQHAALNTQALVQQKMAAVKN